MPDASNQNDPPLPAHTGVLLLAPELFAAPPDPAVLRASLTRAYPRVRLLMRAVAASDLALAETLSRAGVEVEVLLPDGISAPPTNLTVARMPPGSKPTDTDELALALCDGLLAETSVPDLPLVRLARKLNKPLLLPGEKPPPLAGSHHIVTRRLDPERPGWHRALRRISGRMEQFALEFWTFNWLGRDDDGRRSRDKLRACLPDQPWTHTPHFGPDNWRDLAPDRTAVDATSPLVANFDRLDRSALYGAYIHRDLAWANYGAAALAVFFAVAGFIGLFPFAPDTWAKGEFLVLLFILVTTFASRKLELQDRWTACRFGAEQLRNARMCLPLLVVPNALCSVDAPARGDHSLQALAEVKRAVRDQGLPRISPDESPIDAARWVASVVAYQIEYHRRNHRKLHRAEERLTWLAAGLVLASFVAVCLHYWLDENPYLLIFTAAGPAFAAAAHGVTTRLGLVHRIALSRDAESELSLVNDELQEVIGGSGSPEPAWKAVRSLAFRAAEAMGRETTSWHSQVRRQKDELP
jgi:hypothetical protein